MANNNSVIEEAHKGASLIQTKNSIADILIKSI